MTKQIISILASMAGRFRPHRDPDCRRAAAPWLGWRYAFTIAAMKSNLLALLLILWLGGGCTIRSNADVTWENSTSESLAGAWRSRVQFESGAFASIKDLEFLYVFNPSTGSGQGDGGTMTESSNYDASPPVPPAYGVWRRVGPREFEAKYLFYMTKSPAKFEDITAGGGWAPAGHGELIERITLSDDGNSFTSTIRFESFDAAGKATADGGTAKGRGQRVRF